MKNENFHPSDQQLLLFADGELPAHLVAKVRVHLQACWDCRSRMAEIENTITGFMQVHRRAFDAQVPPIDGSRAQLRSRLAELAGSARGNQRLALISAFGARLAYACALIVLIFLGVRTVQRFAAANRAGSTVSAGPLPNPRFTPGATTTVAIGSICSMSDDEVVVPVPGSLKQKVFREYGIADAPAANYEVDYLITPGLGGAGDIRNLWPEPRYDTVWNSFVKDQLEDYLHRAVCGGKVSLPVAQHEIATNWIAAYKKYFHTDHPLAGASASVFSAMQWTLAPGALSEEQRSPSRFTPGGRFVFTVNAITREFFS